MELCCVYFGEDPDPTPLVTWSGQTGHEPDQCLRRIVCQALPKLGVYRVGLDQLGVREGKGSQRFCRFGCKAYIPQSVLFRIGN